MDSFNILVMMQDGSFTDYEVRNKRNDVIYEILLKGEPVATFKASPDGTWTVTENPANINDDVIGRISKQLQGYHI
ncbi:MAG TPA: hypothetical protein VGE26_07820 [Sphingobacteriaceae bacterium]